MRFPRLFGPFLLIVVATATFPAAALEPPELAPAPYLPEAARTFSGAPRPKQLQRKTIAINASSRRQVVTAYQSIYLPALQISSGWTGALTGCQAGVTSADYAQATLTMVNYYRAMVGLPGDVVLDATVTAKCQQSALMMLAQGSLSHTPPTSWACYTAGGAEAAGKSNIALGSAGPSSIALYMNDFGSGNTAVGHRRWILYPPQIQMGTGSVTGTNGFYHGANDLWVIGTFGTPPASPAWTAWPPAGYVPYNLVYARWSFSRANANFSNATIKLWRDGAPVSVTKLAVANGYGDNTLVWEPANMPLSKPAEDILFHIEIDNALVSGATTSWSYDVIAIDPDLVIPENAARHWERFD
jgi:uncharacterized protein YkwD